MYFGNNICKAVNSVNKYCNLIAGFKYFNINVVLKLTQNLKFYIVTVIV